MPVDHQLEGTKDGKWIQMKSKFSYGDAVIIKQDAPSSLHPGEFGSVCSLHQIISEQEAKKFECQIGEWVYTIEFGDGSDIQIAEFYLEKDLGVIKGNELSKYKNYFIGGFVFNIKIYLNYLEIKMKSEKVYQSVPEPILVAADECISGQLIISQIQEMTIRNNSLSMALQEKGTILEFAISDQLIDLLIEWRPNKNTSFHIKAGQIWWEQR